MTTPRLAPQSSFAVNTVEQTTSYVHSWFGEVVENPALRLWPFAQTGGEGSMAALWLDATGRPG